MEILCRELERVEMKEFKLEKRKLSLKTRLGECRKSDVCNSR